MSGNKKWNSDLDLLGKMKISTVPNNTGTVLTYNDSTKEISQRTNAQIIGDLGLITATNIASLYYTKTELQTPGQSQVNWGNLTNVPTTFTPSAHNHDDRYHLKSESVPYTGADKPVDLNSQELILNGGDLKLGTNSSIWQEGYLMKTYNHLLSLNRYSSSATGILSIKIPQASTSPIMTDTLIRVYSYARNFIGTIRISFYKNSINTITTRNALLEVGSTFPTETINVGIDAANNICINIGDTTTVWSSYLTFEVERFQVSHTGSNANWSNGWTYAIETDTSTYQNLYSIVPERVVLSEKTKVINTTGNATNSKVSTNNIGSSNGTIRVVERPIEFTQWGNPVGAMVIKLPKITSVIVKGIVRNAETGHTSSFMYSAYTTATTVAHLSDTTYINQIRRGTDASGNTYIIFNDIGTTWAYPQIIIEEVYFYAGAPLNWNDSSGYEISVLTDLTGITLGNVPLTISANQDWVNTQITNATHSHSNKAFLDTINQNLGTSNEVSFNTVKTSRLGHYGTYVTAQTQNIWSIGPAYNVSASDTTLGTIYGLGYSFINVGGSSATDEHQIHFAFNGAARVSVSLTNGNIRTIGGLIKSGVASTGFWKADGTIDNNVYFSNEYFKGKQVTSVTSLDSALPNGGYISSYTSSNWGGSDRPTGADYGGYIKFSGHNSDINNLDFYYNSVIGRLWFRTKNLSEITTWKELYHTGNFNPSDYALSSHTHTWASITSKPTTISGFGITDVYTKAQVDGLVASTYRPKGSVANFAALPTTGQQEGDVWNLLDTGKNVVWVLNLNNTGSPGWDDLSGTIDLSSYALQSWVTTNFASSTHSHSWGQITGKPTFHAVATSGNYNDLSNLPNLSIYALANGTNAAGSWANSSNGLENNPTLAGKTMDGVGNPVSLTNATQGTIAGYINSSGIANGNPDAQWYYRIKMLHPNPAGYNGEIAVQMTGSLSLRYRRMENGSESGWIKTLDEATNSFISGMNSFRTTGNQYDSMALHVYSDTGIAPAIAFHQSGQYAGSIAMVSATLYQFRNQTGTGLINAQASNLYANNNVEAGNQVIAEEGFVHNTYSDENALLDSNGGVAHTGQKDIVRDIDGVLILDTLTILQDTSIVTVPSTHRFVQVYSQGNDMCFIPVTDNPEGQRILIFNESAIAYYKITLDGINDIFTISPEHSVECYIADGKLYKRSEIEFEVFST